MTPRVGSVVAVDWLDHYDAAFKQEHAWTDASKVEIKPVLIRSVGFVVKVTDEALAVAHTLQQGECSAPFVILRAAIVRCEPIKLPPLRREPEKKR